MCSDEEWREIGRRWEERIRYERQISFKKHQRLISRFHASDCSTFNGDFRGWSQPRQVRLMKKLIEIIGQSKPVGIAVTAQLGDFISGYPDQEKQRHRGCYFFCMMAVLLLIGDWLQARLPGERVAIVYDRGTLSDWGAQKAFTCMKADGGWNNRNSFVSMAPIGWEECVPLQAADLLAYEGYKVVDRYNPEKTELRRSLESIIGHGVPIQVQTYQPDAFQKLAGMQMIMSEAQGNPSTDLRRVMDLVKSQWGRDRFR